MPDEQHYITPEELEDLAGEPLTGSGFENETPEPDYEGVPV